MKVLKKIRGKKLGIYIRKETREENLSTGYGRLQWMRYELGEHEGGLEIYIDEKDSTSNINKLFDDINNGYIKSVMLWSLTDVESPLINILGLLCDKKKIPIITFC
jgi:hypothetical protein